MDERKDLTEGAYLTHLSRRVWIRVLPPATYHSSSVYCSNPSVNRPTSFLLSNKRASILAARCCRPVLCSPAPDPLQTSRRWLKSEDTQFGFNLYKRSPSHASSP